METVTVAQLKARLSHYLREVRAGTSFVVVSRDIPVAVLGPCDAAGGDDLTVIEPDSDAPALSAPVLGRPAAVDADAVDLIREDRDERDRRLDAFVRNALIGARATRQGDDR